MAPGPQRPWRVPNFRSYQTSHRRAKNISRPAHGVDHRRPVGVDLLPQVGNVKLDHVGLAAEVVVPDPIEDLGLAEDAARIAHQIAEQLELGGGQLDLDPTTGDLMAVLIESQITHDERRAALGQAGAAASK